MARSSASPEKAGRVDASKDADQLLAFDAWHTATHARETVGRFPTRLFMEQICWRGLTASHAEDPRFSGFRPKLERYDR